jgi:hypothetical protein
MRKALAALLAALPFAIQPRTALAENAPPPPSTAANLKIVESIPAGTSKAYLMRLAFDKGAEEISARFNKAVEASPAWFQDYLERNANIKPLPYHKNFGVSEEEYAKMLKMFESKRLEKVKELEVLVSKTGGRVLISCPELGRAFPGLELDENDGSLKCAFYGDPPIKAEKASGGKDSPFGAWEGLRWSRTEANAKDGDYKSLSLHLGASEKGPLFLDLRLKAMKNRRISANYESVLEIDAKKP